MLCLCVKKRFLCFILSLICFLFVYMPVYAVNETSGRYYTLKYDMNAGDSSQYVLKRYLSDMNIVVEDPNVENGSLYFLYWNDDKYGNGTIVYPGDVISLNGNMTLYAVWKNKPYKLVYYFSDNDVVPDVTVDSDVSGSSDAFDSDITDEDGGQESDIAVSEYSDVYIYEDDQGVVVPDNAGGELVIYWTAEPDGEGDIYYPGDIITHEDISGDISLYPVFPVKNIVTDVSGRNMSVDSGRNMSVDSGSNTKESSLADTSDVSFSSVEYVSESHESAAEQGVMAVQQNGNTGNAVKDSSFVYKNNGRINQISNLNEHLKDGDIRYDDTSVEPGVYKPPRNIDIGVFSVFFVVIGIVGSIFLASLVILTVMIRNNKKKK